jgi:hypothetical protein
MDEAFPAPKAEFPIHGILLLFLVFIGTGCQLFHPRDMLSIPEIAGKEAKPVEFPLSSIRFELAAYDLLDQSLEVFDSDLPRAGIHPVWVRIKNSATHLLDLEGSHISLVSKGASSAHLIPPKLMVDLIYNSYRTRIFSPYFRSQLENQFEEMRLKLVKVLPGQEISGYLFFGLESKEYGLLRGARLRWSEIKSPESPEMLAVEYTFPTP